MFNFFAKGNQQPPAGAPPAPTAAGGTPPAAQPQPQAAANLEHHKAVVAHFNQLLKVGYDPAGVQAQWQQYYDQLGDADKLLVTQLMSGAQAAAAEEALADDADEVTPVKPIDQQVDYNTYQEKDATSSDPRSLNRFFGASVALKKYNAWSALTRKKKVIPAAVPAAALNAPAVPIPGGAPPPAGRPQVPSSTPPPAASQMKTGAADVPGGSLGGRARSMLYWNSNTALFDQGESKSIMHQNYKSILFGLTVGVIFMVLWQFAFLNERFIQPFIRPSLASDVQILISPEAQEIDDPTFRLIIPRLGISAIVYDELEPRGENESFGSFENRVQDALLEGVLHYPTSQFPGQNGDGFKSNIVIMGHSSGILLLNDSSREQKYKFIFKQLNELNEGDVIQIYYERKEYVYKIYKKKIVRPKEVEVLRSGRENPDLAHNGTLTLITCEPPGTVDFRLVLLAEQIKPVASENEEVQLRAGDKDEDFVPGETPGFF